MGAAKRIFRLWSDEHGISSVEYVLLLAIIGSSIIAGAELLGDVVSNELIEAAGWFGDDGCGNDGSGDGTGGDGGSGQGGGNTC